MTAQEDQLRLLGVDYGTKKCGLAITDPLGITCRPLESVKTEKLIATIKALVAEFDLSAIIVGWPLNEDGSEAAITRTVDKFISTLEKRVKTVPIKRWDERYSSMRARERLVTVGVKKKKREKRGIVDSVSAVIILEEFLEANPQSI